jgi:hypothetical protein
VKQALQAAGLVKRKARRGVHRKRRERRPLPGMMLHIDGSEHRWFQDERKHDLIVKKDKAAQPPDRHGTVSCKSILSAGRSYSQPNNHAKDLRHQFKATEVRKKKRRSIHQSPFDCGINPKELPERPRRF